MGTKIIFLISEGSKCTGFHSINVPSEWGLALKKEKISGIKIFCRFHSINVPSEWGQLAAWLAALLLPESFHSINVPSEWGLG